jgi:hypothetical protein
LDAGYVHTHGSEQVLRKIEMNDGGNEASIWRGAGGDFSTRLCTAVQRFSDSLLHREGRILAQVKEDDARKTRR